jgi:NitT/TauT family transport system substrate-binding protein
VKWINVDVNALAPMLINRKVDSSPMFASHAYWVGKAAKEQGQKLVVLPYADAGFKIYSYCIYTTEELIEKNPDLAKRFVAATVKSFLWAHDHIDEAVAIHHQKYPDIALDEAKGSLSIMYDYVFPPDVKVSDFGHYNQDRLKATYQAAASAQNLPPDTDVNQFIDLRFLPAIPPQ